VPPGHIPEDTFLRMAENATKRNIPLRDLLVGEGLISEENLGKTIANYFDYRFVDLSEVQIEDMYLKVIPEVVARAQEVTVFEITDEVLKVATSNLDNYEFIKLLEKKTKKKIEVYFTTHALLEEALQHYKGDLHKQIGELIEACSDKREEGDIVNLVDLLLEYAHDSRASDIHIEPLEEEVLIRFRIDGILHEAAKYPMKLHKKIVFRIKIMAHLQTDEHGAAQDGRFDYASEDNIFDVRVSIMPITNGENVVMRLLSSHVRKHTLETLGLSQKDLKKIKAAAKKPHGMIISAGPTGSGKTTLLYTVLEKLNQPEVNIMTIEDPVEYDIERVQQTQVNPKKNLTFSTGLRSIVRQDQISLWLVKYETTKRQILLLTLR